MKSKDCANGKGTDFAFKVQWRFKRKIAFLLLVSEFSWLLLREGIDHLGEKKRRFAPLCCLH